MPDTDLSPVATALVHIGARDDTLLLAAPTKGQRHALVQPDPAQAQALRKTVGADAEVLELGLAAASGQADILQMNFGALSSFHDPTAELRALFPGLKVLRRLSVPVLSPADLLKRLDAEDRVIDLVLDSPGSELALLRGWKEAGALEHVGRLVLRCGSEVFFDGAAARPEIDAFLGAEGFTLQAEDLSDPDWPITRWHADPALRALKARLAEAQGATEAKAKALSEAEARVKAVEATAQGLEAKLAEMQAAADAQKADHAALAEKAERRHSRIQQLEAALKSAETKAQGLEAKLAEAQGATEAKAKALTAAEARVKAVEDEFKALSEKAEWRSKRIQELEAAVKAREETTETLRNEIATQKAAHQQQQHRLTVARDDLRRAEGQIELIKDLLLRGETL